MLFEIAIGAVACLAGAALQRAKDRHGQRRRPHVIGKMLLPIAAHEGWKKAGTQNCLSTACRNAAHLNAYQLGGVTVALGCREPLWIDGVPVPGTAARIYAAAVIRAQLERKALAAAQED